MGEEREGNKRGEEREVASYGGFTCCGLLGSSVV